MITTLVLNQESLTFERIEDPDEINNLCAQPRRIIWVDVADPTSQDFEELAKEFGFHPLSIEDCRNEHQRPKVEEYQGYYFIVLYESELVLGKHLELRELNIFLGKNYLVTVHSQPIRAIEMAARLWREWTDLAERGTGLLAYLIIDAIVDNYMSLLDALSDRMDELEDNIFVDFQPSALEEIFRIKKDLLFMRRSVTPLRDVFNTLLRREQPIFSRDTLVYF
ncbi:MAG TPA: magnesium transporter CorA family protein, partial [Blastocatellia bacterium]